MSARNYLSAKDRSSGKFDCLPNINQQKFGYRTMVKELPTFLSSTSGTVNRNLNYSYVIEPYMVNNCDRATTPFSDFFSDSEAGTPDFQSEESDSSAGSALRRSNAEASQTLANEWDCIERTLYNEDGEKCARVQIIEECEQWRSLHPQLRIVGKAIRLPEKKNNFKHTEYDEVIAIHYSDYEEYSESEERLSQSSTDVTPQNSPRVSVCENLGHTIEPKVSLEDITDDLDVKLSREKIICAPYNETNDLPDTFSSLLQITPLHIHSPLQRKKQNPCVLRSEIASSRWMRNNRPDSSINCDRNSAKSFVSLDTRNFGKLALSASERNKIMNSRVLTARHRDMSKLQPLCTPEIPSNDGLKANGAFQYNIRKVSLPPLLLEEEKKKVSVSSAKKHYKTRKSTSKSVHQFDRVRLN